MAFNGPTAPDGTPLRPNFTRQSTSGTEIVGGFLRLEENQPELVTTYDRMRLYDRMRRTESTIEAMLRSLEMPLIRGTFVVEPASDNPEDVEIAEFCSWNILKKQNWSHFIENAVAFQQFGNVVFESVYDVADWTRETLQQGTKTQEMFSDRVCLKSMDFMHPKTIFRYMFDEKTNELSAIEQLGYWIENGQSRYEMKSVSTDYLMFLIRQQRGRSYDGISILRSAYKNYVAIDALYKIQMIALARNASGVPLLTEPEIGSTSKDRADALAVAQSLRMHEEAGMTLPFGWKLEILNGHVDTKSTDEAIRHHKGQILLAALTQFLGQGADNQGGNRALAKNHTDFFKMTLWSIGQQIADALSHHVVSNLVQWNYGPRAKMPKVKLVKLGGDDVTSWLKNLVAAVTGMVVTPYPEMEDAVLQALDLPPKSREEGDNPEYINANASVSEAASEFVSSGGGSRSMSERRQMQLDEAGGKVPKKKDFYHYLQA